MDTTILEKYIIGRVDPHIYAFTTETVPNYLKVGDTYRPINVRLNEWRNIFPNLHHIYSRSARIDEFTIFRDFAVHDFLENTKLRRRLLPNDIPALPYYSREFFKDATPSDVDEAIEDIHLSANQQEGRYKLYSNEHIPERVTYVRGASYKPRKNQEEVISNFQKALAAGRRNLLMYAVMRFGKSFTSLCCAKAMGAKTILVLSAKSDVRKEWKKTVESIGNFEGYIFADKNDLLADNSYIQKRLTDGKTVVLFLTLQDLQGDEIKSAHREVFSLNWDLLLVDETHFGARAEHYGRLIKDKKELALQLVGVDTIDSLDEIVKELRTRVTIHLSGTPYRVLMGSEFEKEDIIAFVQYSDIVNAQEEWTKLHRFDEDKNEWDNPYYGFPQLIRFAFNPNKASLERIAQLEASGATSSFSEMFKPLALSKCNPDHKRFAQEDVVLDFLKIIDGAKNDENVLGFLDNDRIKEGKLCRHIVIVLPYCASCDAFECLIKTHSKEFRNLGSYEILNISGCDRNPNFDDTETVKKQISKCESEGKKTLTLTVNRMLTGNTVPEWDTMIFLKNTTSPEEYDQAVFRLQNPYVVEYLNADGISIKFNKKPQTILVDFAPERMFRLQERKSQIYNTNTDINGNNHLQDRIEEELRISPIITLDHNCLREITMVNIMDAVRNYAETRSVIDEASSMAVDLKLLSIPEIANLVSGLTPIDSKKGIAVKANVTPEGDEGGDDVQSESSGSSNDSDSSSTTGKNNSSDNSEDNKLPKKLATYYALILFYAYLTNDSVKNLQDIIDTISETADNQRIAQNLGLSKDILILIQKFSNSFILRDFDYKIQNLNSLSQDNSLSPLDRVEKALTKFGRMSDSEIVTPLNVATEMVSILPKDVFSAGPILDIASKQGEFTIALVKRFGSSCANMIYSVCTSSIAYEFTRKVYSYLNIPAENIFSKFTSYDLIVPDNQELINLLSNMNFATVIGNPPYQVNDGSGASDDAANPVYQEFFNISKGISSDFVSLIMPSKWMIGGKIILKPFRREMMTDRHIIKLCDYEDCTACFSNLHIDGGICHFLRSKKYSGKVDYTFITENGEKIAQSRFLDDGNQDVVIRDIRRLSIIKKVTNNIESFKAIVSLTQPFGIRKDLFNSPERYPTSNLQPNKFDNSVKIYGVKGIKGGARRLHGFISRDTVSRNTEAIDQYKLFFTTSYSTNATCPPQSIEGMPNEVCTETFLMIGPFVSEVEQKNCKKYLETMFFKSLIFFGKGTMQVSREVFRFIPNQDFTSSSDIDWQQSISDIDEQLFAKYGISESEISFIKSLLKI